MWNTLLEFLISCLTGERLKMVALASKHVYVHRCSKMKAHKESVSEYFPLFDHHFVFCVRY